jgi:chorismate synthase
MANSIGHQLVFTSFGESHGPMVGGVLDGFPSNFAIDMDMDHIQKELDRRKPGQSTISTDRKEDDLFDIVSGVFDGKSTGAPIAIIIKNTGHNSKDYTSLKDVFRPGHADFTYTSKYGNRDYLGGGRSSARITAAWVAAGAIAKQFLKEKFNISIQSVVSKIHKIQVDNVFKLDWSQAENNLVRCPDANIAQQMIELIADVKEKGDSVGGVISTKIEHCPIGIGEPIFDKLNASLAHAMYSINAVKGVEFGNGFEGTNMYGSQFNDAPDKNSNHEGGINAGISTGKNIEFNVAFKPVSSIKTEQKALNTHGEMVDLKIEGRHDPCVLPRAVPIVEAMAALVICDQLLLNLKYKI